MSTLRQIIYASEATTAFPPATLLELLTFCRKSNPQAGLTGLLVFRDNTFLQLLEGPRDQVTRVFGKIAVDPRHHDVNILVDREVTERSFPDWSMGFEEVNEVALNSWPGLSHVLQPPRSSAEWASQPDLALAFFTACHDDFQLSRRSSGTP